MFVQLYSENSSGSCAQLEALEALEGSSRALGEALGALALGCLPARLGWPS